MSFFNTDDEESNGFPELIEEPNGFPDHNTLFGVPENPDVPKIPDVPENPAVPEALRLPEDLGLFLQILMDLRNAASENTENAASDPNIVPGLSPSSLIAAVSPYLALLTNREWRWMMNELSIWSLISRLPEIFVGFTTSVVDNKAHGPAISTENDSGNIMICLAKDGSGILVNIVYVHMGLVYAASFIVDPMNTIVVNNANGVPLNEEIVVAQFVDGDVIHSDVVHPAVTLIYGAHEEILKAILLSSA
jgi:hypothetical protein